jgi:membrane protein DedA with SNARE-associated domain
MIELSPTHLFMTFGVWAVFGAAMLESMGLPFPSEGVLVTAAVIAGSHGEPSLASLIVAGAFGAIIGDNIAYWAGRKAGLPILQRYGHYIRLTEPRLRLGRYLFLRYGGRIVFFGRFISVLRTFAALFAGVNQMPISRFVVANALGGTAWATIVASGAYALGTQVHRMTQPVALGGAVLAFVAVLALGLWLRQEEVRLQAEADRTLADRSGSLLET